MPPSYSSKQHYCSSILKFQSQKSIPAYSLTTIGTMSDKSAVSFSDAQEHRQLLVDVDQRRMSYGATLDSSSRDSLDSSGSDTLVGPSSSSSLESTTSDGSDDTWGHTSSTGLTTPTEHSEDVLRDECLSPESALFIPSDCLQPGGLIKKSNVIGVGESFQGGIAGVEGPEKFWITSNRDRLRRKNLIDSMTKLYNKLVANDLLPRNMDAVLTPGLFVACYDKKQRIWLRARIVNRDSREHYTVNYVDMVGHAKFANGQIRFLLNAFQDPPCIIECNLSFENLGNLGGCVNNDGEVESPEVWAKSDKALKKFYELVFLDAMVFVKIIKCSKKFEFGVWTVQLKTSVPGHLMKIDNRTVIVAEEMLRSEYQLPVLQIYINTVDSDSEDDDGSDVLEIGRVIPQSRLSLSPKGDAGDSDEVVEIASYIPEQKRIKLE